MLESQVWDCVLEIRCPICEESKRLPSLGNWVGGVLPLSMPLISIPQQRPVTLSSTRCDGQHELGKHLV